MKTTYHIHSFLIAVFILVQLEKLYPQVNHLNINQLQREAKNSFDKDDFPRALSLYGELYKLDPKDPYINFYYGFSILAVGADLSSAIPCLTYAYRHIKKDMPYSIRYLAAAYHMDYQFEKAIELYTEYKQKLSPDIDWEEYREIKRKIEMCYNGMALMKDSVSMKIENIGGVINTPYSEYAPMISADEEKLIFTSRRPSGTDTRKAAEGGYFEDIYMSLRENGKWAVAQKINEVDTRGHDANISLSADGQTMFIYRQGDIYSSKLNGNSWSKPQKLGREINTSGWETHASIAYHERELYFVSDRKGGYGGRDIYKASKLPNGEWGQVENLGPTVNTPYDEECPSIHPDGRTLYFSSTGHNSMGGFDIFSTTYSGNLWTEPTNMGNPINTPADNLFFTVSAQGNHAYFSGSIANKCYGEKDIYMITLPASGNIPLTVVRGRIYNEEGKPIMANFTVTDNDTREIVGHYNSNSVSGKYLLVFPPGKNYSFIVEAEGYTPHNEQVFVPDQHEYYDLFQEIKLMSVQNGEMVVGQEVLVKNAFFNVQKAAHLVDSSRFNESSKEEVFSAFLNDLNDPHKQDEIVKKIQTDSELTAEIASNYASGEQPFLFNKKELAPSGIEAQDLVYAVQIGVYSKPVTADKLYNIAPLHCTITSGEYVRYTYSTGKFNAFAEALNRKNEVVNMGVTDAFITAYYKGVRITIANAIAIENRSKPEIQDNMFAISNFSYLYAK